jgi:2-dehydropantoate 2-reductase
VSDVAVVGVGSIGGYAAAQLHRAGHRLALCGRRPFDRLLVEAGGEAIVVDVPASTEPAEAAEAEWVVVATKATANGAARTWLDALCGPSTQGVLVLQNGIEGAADLARAGGAAPTIPAVVLIGAELLAPGHVRHHGASRIVVPEGHRFAVGALFAGTALEVDGTDDFVTAAWQKLVMNCMSGPVCALTGRRLEVFHDPAVASLALDIGREAVSVGVAAGAQLDAGLPEEVLATLQAQPPGMGGSMLYDRLAGRPTEHDAILGAVARAGAAAGLPTPRCSTLGALLDGCGGGPPADSLL